MTPLTRFHCTLVGYSGEFVPEPPVRGTSAIIIGCMATMTLVFWSNMRLNMTRIGEGKVKRFCRKLWWFVLSVWASEWVALMAADQHCAARLSVEDFKKIQRDKPWSLTHAMFANSGGIVLRDRQGGVRRVTAEELLILVRKRIIPMPTISKNDITDKSKTDAFKMTMAIIQIIWILGQVLSMWKHNQPVTLLEYQVLSCTMYAAFGYWFWWHKPLDAEYPILCDVEPSMAIIEQRLREDVQDERDDYPLRTLKHNWIIRLHEVDPRHHWASSLEDLDMLHNDRNPIQEGPRERGPLTVMALLYAASTVVPGFLYPFPTRVEKILWHSCSFLGTTMLGWHGLGAAVEALARRLYKRVGIERPRGWSPAASPTLYDACFFYWPMILYMLSRFVIIFETLYSMRQLPEGSFQRNSWLTIIPHIGN